MEEPHSDTGGVAVVFGIDHRKASAQVREMMHSFEASLPNGTARRSGCALLFCPLRESSSAPSAHRSVSSCLREWPGVLRCLPRACPQEPEPSLQLVGLLPTASVLGSRHRCACSKREHTCRACLGPARSLCDVLHLRSCRLEPYLW
eukprot:scaffold104802_cov31-Tisochrysis_lutea.AAC.1